MATLVNRKPPADRELKKECLELRIAPSAKQRMVLIGADREVFLDAVQNPPEPAEKLVAALRRHRAMLG